MWTEKGKTLATDADDEDNYVVSATTKKGTGTRIDKNSAANRFDMDGDGELDIFEIEQAAHALRATEHTRDLVKNQNKQLGRLVCFLTMLILGMAVALSVTIVMVVDKSKDTESSNGALVDRESGTTMRTSSEDMFVDHNGELKMRINGDGDTSSVGGGIKVNPVQSINYDMHSEEIFCDGMEALVFKGFGDVSINACNRLSFNRTEYSKLFQGMSPQLTKGAILLSTVKGHFLLAGESFVAYDTDARAFQVSLGLGDESSLSQLCGESESCLNQNLYSTDRRRLEEQLGLSTEVSLQIKSAINWAALRPSLRVAGKWRADEDSIKHSLEELPPEDCSEEGEDDCDDDDDDEGVSTATGERRLGSRHSKYNYKLEIKQAILDNSGNLVPLSLCDVKMIFNNDQGRQRKVSLHNTANGNARQSSTGWDGSPSRAITRPLVEGETDYFNNGCTHTATQTFTDIHGETFDIAAEELDHGEVPMWSVTFRSRRIYNGISILPRSDCCHGRQSHFHALLYRDDVPYMYTDLFNSAGSDLRPAYQDYYLHPCSQKERHNAAFCGVQLLGETQVLPEYALSIHLSNEYLTIAQVDVYTKEIMEESERLLSTDEDFVPLQLETTVDQSSMGWGGIGSRAIDGNYAQSWSSLSLTHTASLDQNWWYVEGFKVPDGKEPTYMRIWNREDCCSWRLKNGFAILHKKNYGESWKAIKGTVAFGEKITNGGKVFTYKLNEISENSNTCSDVGFSKFGCA